MKNKFLPLILLTLATSCGILSCTKEEIIDIENIVNPPIEVIDAVNENSNDTTENSSDTFVEQTIYPTSIQNHEWNSGIYSMERGNPLGFQIWMPSAMTYIDYDFDGDLDIVGRSDSHGDTTPMVVMVNNNGDFSQTDYTAFDCEVCDTRMMGYRKLTSADIDNDGDLDLIGFNASDSGDHGWFGGNFHGGIDLFRYEDGKFRREVVRELAEGMQNFFHGGALADINNDGWVDIVGGTGGLIILNNNGNFDTEPFYAVEDAFHKYSGYSGDWFSMDIIDINGDGYQDLLVGEAHDKGSFPFDELREQNREWEYGYTKKIFFGKSSYPYFEQDAYFLETEYDYYGTDDFHQYALSATLDFAVNDMDGDGDLDIITYSHSPLYQEYEGDNLTTLEYFENKGNSKFEVNNTIFADNSNNIGNQESNWFKLYDVDNDGSLEIVLEATQFQNGYIVWKLNSENKYEKKLWYIW